MNRDNININNSTAGDRRTYLSPRTELIKMETTNPLAESLGIPRTDEDTDEAYGKQWQDDSDSWDEVDANPYKKAKSLW